MNHASEQASQQASKADHSWFFPSYIVRTRAGLHLLLHLHLYLDFFSLPLLTSSTHTVHPTTHHSTICFLHFLALTAGSLISIQSSRSSTLVNPSPPPSTPRQALPLFPIQPPASTEHRSSAFVQVSPSTALPSRHTVSSSRTARFATPAPHRLISSADRVLSRSSILQRLKHKSHSTGPPSLYRKSLQLSLAPQTVSPACPAAGTLEDLLEHAAVMEVAKRWMQQKH